MLLLRSQSFPVECIVVNAMAEFNANLRNHSTHVETVDQTDGLINMCRQNSGCRKTRKRNIKHTKTSTSIRRNHNSNKINKSIKTKKSPKTRTSHQEKKAKNKPKHARTQVTHNARDRKKNKKDTNRPIEVYNRPRDQRTIETSHQRTRYPDKKLYLNDVPIKVVSTHKALTVATDELLSYNPSYLGIDCEWKPQFRKSKRQNKVSLLQIAHSKLIILIQLNHFTRVYHSLSTSGMLKILHSKKIIKCGVGIMDDRQKMYDDHGVNIKRCVELNHLNMYPIHTRHKPAPYFGLAKLCKKVLQCEMQYKSKKITMSNWENYVLTEKQIMYAADDAFIGYQILETLLELNHQMGSVRALLRDIDDYMDRKLVDHSLETCRDEMTRIAQYYTYFPLYDLDEIHVELFGYGMKKKHKKKVSKLVVYFDDIFEMDTGKSSRVYSKIQ
eukprot:775290_1